MKPNTKEKGQGLFEYALILFLVAVVVVAILVIVNPPINKGPAIGTVIDQKVICSVDDIKINTQGGQTQQVGCSGPSRIEVDVNFNGVQTTLWTDVLSTVFKPGENYSFKFDLDGQIIQSFPAK